MSVDRGYEVTLTSFSYFIDQFPSTIRDRPILSRVQADCKGVHVCLTLTFLVHTKAISRIVFFKFYLSYCVFKYDLIFCTFYMYIMCTLKKCQISKGPHPISPCHVLPINSYHIARCSSTTRSILQKKTRFFQSLLIFTICLIDMHSVKYVNKYAPWFI